GHFYQPPRENPWLEAIEVQDSAYPYHDWNERITDECYAPNSTARILDGERRIERIVNNYRHISFDFGPTLLSWLQRKRPELYRRIIAADGDSATRFSGHGSAMAQAYHHLIMPLACPRDRRTEVIWGLRDFRHRFGREPEGMWLPECAVDTDCLEILAAHGIAFTVLSPRQARRVRGLDEEQWHEVDADSLDTTRPYRVELPSGAAIVVFFFDDRIAREVSFGGLLHDGARLARRLCEGTDGDRLVHLATDGETFGHHHRHGEMALAWALQEIGRRDGVRLTNYAEFLDGYEVTDEAEIVEASSWSCAHGVERWRSDCGCVTGREDWGQEWRAPLRAALDWLRDALAQRYEERMGELFDDPWKARNDYIDVVLDRSDESLAHFFEQHATRRPTRDERVTALRLFEMQRRALQMYTSCGWFFDDISRIETVQILGYAARAVQLGCEVFDEDLESGLVARLKKAPSNVETFGDGEGVWRQLVAPTRVDLSRVAAHFAVGNLFGEYQREDDVYVYRVEGTEQQRRENGPRKLAIGRARVTSRITHYELTSAYAVIHFGGHDLAGWVGPAEVATEALAQSAEQSFESDLAGLIRDLDSAFGDRRFSLHSLFRDEQRRIADRLLRPTVRKAEETYHELFDADDPKIEFLEEHRLPLPDALKTAARHLLNMELRELLEARPFDLDRTRRLIDLARTFDISLDSPGLALQLQHTLANLTRRLAADPDRREILDKLRAAVTLVDSLPFEVDLWEPQNILYGVICSEWPAHAERAAAGGARGQRAGDWLDGVGAVAAKLSLRVE
ncbi:MAG: DUF3536 domain-containing protein, partial [Acidobacteriota bacterium]